MGSLDPAKVLVILVVALIVLGPEKLPRVARQLGAAWHELTRIREQVSEEVRAIIPDDAVPRGASPSQAVASVFAGLGGRGAQPDARDPSEGARGADASRAPGGNGSGVFGAHTAPGDAGPDSGRAGALVVHPSLGDFAFVPDDPSMN